MNSITQYTVIVLNYIRKHTNYQLLQIKKFVIIKKSNRNIGYSDEENYTAVFDLRLKLISRSPLWLGSNIVAFHTGGTEFDPRYNINLCFVPDCQSNIIHNINILLRIDYDHHTSSLRPCGLKHTTFFIYNI